MKEYNKKHKRHLAFGSHNRGITSLPVCLATMARKRSKKVSLKVKEAGKREWETTLHSSFILFIPELLIQVYDPYFNFNVLNSHLLYKTWWYTEW